MFGCLSGWRFASVYMRGVLFPVCQRGLSEGTQSALLTSGKAWEGGTERVFLISRTEPTGLPYHSHFISSFLCGQDQADPT